MEPVQSVSGNAFPLYYRLVYQRKSTMLKSISNDSFIHLEDPKCQKNLEEDMKDLKVLAFLLSNCFTEELNLVGFKEKYIKAQTKVISILDSSIRHRINQNLINLDNPLASIINIKPTTKALTLHILLEGLSLLFKKKDLEKLLHRSEKLITLYDLLSSSYNKEFASKKLIHFLDTENLDPRFLQSIRENFTHDQSIKLYEYLIDFLRSQINE